MRLTMSVLGGWKPRSRRFVVTTLFCAVVLQIFLASVSAQVFLQIDTDARTSGMASAGAATSQGPNAAYFNPALLALERTGRIRTRFSAGATGPAHGSGSDM